jgi:hypothetical protein
MNDFMVEIYEKQLAEALKRRDKAGEGTALRQLGYHRAQHGDIPQGLSMLNDAYSIFTALGASYNTELAEVHYAMSDIYGYMLHSHGEGSPHLQKAVELSAIGSTEHKFWSEELERVKSRYPELF